MPDRIRINGQWYDASNVPPWFEDIRPHVDGAPTDEQEWLRARQEAAANARRNRRGILIGNGCLWGLLGAILTISGILLAKTLF